MIAALFVAEDGPYVGRPNVDAWTKGRDARTYQGPHPVVAHPPCERWGRYARGGPNPNARRFEIGADDGCFKSALESVRYYCGVLEHPCGSHAWRHFGLPMPPKVGWSEPDSFGGRSCRVDQGQYGHAARKATWLYAVLPMPVYPELDWSRSVGKVRLELGPSSKEHAKAIRSAPGYKPPKVLSKKERVHTPEPFVNVLVGMAWTARAIKGDRDSSGRSSDGLGETEDASPPEAAK